MLKSLEKSGQSPSAAATRAWIDLMRTQKQLLDRIEEDLKQAGLPPLGWYDVLLELWRADDGRLRPLEIERRTLLAQYNLSRLLNRLEREGLIEFQAFDEDGRGKWAVITTQGRQVREAMWAVYGVSIRRHVEAKLSEAEAVKLSALLAKLSA
jgi:DNA-binding MarR family transcriptional regulator